MKAEGLFLLHMSESLVEGIKGGLYVVSVEVFSLQLVLNGVKCSVKKLNH